MSSTGDCPGSIHVHIVYYMSHLWGGHRGKHRDAKRLDKLLKRAGTVIGVRLDSLEDVVERCIVKKVAVI